MDQNTKPRGTNMQDFFALVVNLPNNMLCPTIKL